MRETPDQWEAEGRVNGDKVKNVAEKGMQKTGGGPVKVKITETRELIIELKPEHYDPEDRTPEKMIAVELRNIEELPEYMENDAVTSTVTIVAHQ